MAAEEKIADMQVCGWVNRDEYAQIKAISEAQGKRSISSIVRQAVIEFLKAAEKSASN